MLEQPTIKRDWVSEGFRANELLHESKQVTCFPEQQTSKAWKANTNSRLISQLRESVSAWGTAKAGASVRKRIHALKPVQLEFDFDLEKTFRTLADEWLDATEHISNMSKAIKHPAYQQIIGMGKVAHNSIVSLILMELKRNPDHWFWALREITKQDPAQAEDTFDGAVHAWLDWGKKHKYLT